MLQLIRVSGLVVIMIVIVMMLCRFLVVMRVVTVDDVRRNELMDDS